MFRFAELHNALLDKAWGSPKKTRHGHATLRPIVHSGRREEQRLKCKGSWTRYDQGKLISSPISLKFIYQFTGQAGEFTRAPGFLSYYEICDRIFNQGWTVVQDPKGRLGPYAYKGNQWVSFDDQATLQRKTRFIRELGLAGGMIW